MSTIAEKLTLTGVAAVLLTASTSACALFSDDEARKAILDLREKVAAAQNAQLQLANEIERLKQQNAELTGRIEKLTRAITVEQKSSQELFSNLDKRVSSVEPREVSLDGEKFMASPEESRRYDLAMDLFGNGEYGKCAPLFDSIVKDFPKSGYVPSVLYWYGNALFAQKRLHEAITMLDRLIVRYPNSPRRPDAMLSKASALSSLGKNKEAESVLTSVRKRYPNTEAGKLASERLNRMVSARLSAERVAAERRAIQEEEAAKAAAARAAAARAAARAVAERSEGKKRQPAK